MRQCHRLIEQRNQRKASACARLGRIALGYFMGMLAGALALLLVGCSTVRTETGLAAHITDAMLLDGNLVLDEATPVSLASIDVLAMTPDMVDFIDFYVDRSAPPHIRLRQLMDAISHSSALNLDYTSHTFTAAQTFSAGHGNCLSFTNLFIAMARDLDLRAEYQEVDIPPYWDRDGDTMILNRHINIHVRTSANGRGIPSVAEIVDFNSRDVKSHYPTQRISDDRGKAHYYSNLGVEYLQAGRHAQAFLFMREGLRLDPSFDALWINLGVLYARLGHFDYAEQSYLRALKYNESMTALSSLARVYERLGDTTRAQEYQHRVADYRENNPYYRYHLAKIALDEGDYAQARHHLEQAMTLKASEDAFPFLLGVVHLRAGDPLAAQAGFDQARALAKDARTRYRYNAQIRLLEQDPNSKLVDL